MTYEVARTPPITLVDEAEVAVSSWRYDRRIEIDQVRVIRRIALRIAYTMWLMACIAGRTLSANMLVMLTEALVAQNTVATVAAVAKCVVTRTLGRIVRRHVVADENWLEARTMRTLRPGTTSAGRLVGVVAVHTADGRILRQRIDEARNVRIPARRGYGMERRRVRLDLQTDIGLVVLAGCPCRRLVRTVAVTPQAYFVGVNGRTNFGTSDIHAADVVRRIAGAAAGTRSMRVMAIGALDMARIDDRRLGRIMDKRRVGDTMRRKLREALHDVF